MIRFPIPAAEKQQTSYDKRSQTLYRGLGAVALPGVCGCSNQTTQSIDPGEPSQLPWSGRSEGAVGSVGLAAEFRPSRVVIMSDGVDNALGGSNLGSQISFADWLETVRKSDELIIPIYLDTERDRQYMSVDGKRMYENARNTLALLAQKSGGLYYQAITPTKVGTLKGTARILL